MADKLDWLNDHLILLKHRNVQDVVFEENYKVPFALKELAYQKSDAESFVKQLATDNKYKEANDFLAYNLHQRALTWWGYCCVLSMIEEQKINPAPIEDIADIAHDLQLGHVCETCSRKGNCLKGSTGWMTNKQCVDWEYKNFVIDVVDN